jgi:hypothetical protein
LTGSLVFMSDAASGTPDEQVAIDADDEAWLEARLQEYRELVVYLREH